MKAVAAIAACVLPFAATAALGQENAEEIQAATDTSRFIFNTLLLLGGASLILLMGAGFAMREAGLVRIRSAATICLQKIAAYAIAAIMTWLVGYNLIALIEPGGLLGDFRIWSADETDPLGAGYSVYATFLYQFALAATACSIISGALAERLKVWPFLVFTAAFAGLIYPIEASWVRSDGFLDAGRGFHDFAGATVLHSAAGWGALAGALVLGPRHGKYAGKQAARMPASNLPIAALGAILLWFGWLALIASAHRSLGTIEDAVLIAKVIVKSNMAAAAGIVAAMILTQIVYKKISFPAVLNGAIAGLVSISAEPVTPAIWQAVIIGGFGGAIVAVAPAMLDRLKIDDVVGAIPAHLFCGVWGTIIVPWTNPDASLIGQAIGISMIGAFVFVMSFLLWIVLKFTIGLRFSAEKEQLGADEVVLGAEAYSAN